PEGSRYREESPDRVRQSASRVPAHRFVRVSPGRNRGRLPQIGTRVSFKGGQAPRPRPAPRHAPRPLPSLVPGPARPRPPEEGVAEFFRKYTTPIQHLVGK